jgi:hypothetical protein
LAGVRAALDAPGEWFMDSSGVYLQTWDSSNPSNHTVEVKRRPLAFDLSNRSYITVKGLNLFASGINSNSSSNHLTLDGIQAKYTAEFYGGDWDPKERDTGIILDGSYNTLQNCTVTHTAGHGVRLKGDHHTVFNCTFEDFDYGASDAAGVYATDPNTDGNWGYHSITYNTFRNGGRIGVEHIRNKGLLISHNLFENISVQSQDGGATYTWMTDGGGTEISYNIIRNSTPLSYSMQLLLAIYLDGDEAPGNRNFLIHHNLIYNLGGTSNGVNAKQSTNVKIYNNTVWGINHPAGIWADGSDIQTYNNLHVSNAMGSDLQNNKTAESGDFVNASAGNFQLQPGSSAIDAGRVIAGITDGYVGSAPDIGAFEQGKTPWTAGANTSGTGTTPLPAPRNLRLVVQ